MTTMLRRFHGLTARKRFCVSAERDGGEACAHGALDPPGKTRPPSGGRSRRKGKARAGRRLTACNWSGWTRAASAPLINPRSMASRHRMTRDPGQHRQEAWTAP